MKLNHKVTRYNNASTKFPWIGIFKQIFVDNDPWMKMTVMTAVAMSDNYDLLDIDNPMNITIIKYNK